MSGEPITIFNFETTLGAILSVVNGIAGNYVTNDRFNQILDTVSTQITSLGTVSSKQNDILTAIQNLITLVQALIQGLSSVAPHASSGNFNPPANLVRLQPVEVKMSVLQLEVGQTATGQLTFSETTPPADGAVTSDNPAVTISLGADHETWTCVAVSVTAANTPVNVTYTGTSVAPDVGPAVVAPMLVTVIPVPAAETGDFNPAGATITGP